MFKLFVDKKWVSNLPWKAWLQLLPLTIMFSALWLTAYTSLKLELGTIKFWEYIVYGWLYGVAGYLAGLGICLKFLRARWLAAVFACTYLLMYGVNAVFVIETGAVFRPFYLWIAGADNWTHYLTANVDILIGGFVLAAVLAVFPIYRQAALLKQLPVGGLIILLAGLFCAPLLRDAGGVSPTKVITSTIDVKNMGIWKTDQTFKLRSLAENPLVILGKAFLYQPKPLDLRPADQLTSMYDALKAWQLPLGARQYPALNLKPFKHIVVFATESLSADFLSPYNTHLPSQLTPFYASPEITNAMFTQYKTVALPTLPGIEVMYNSHPNANGLLVSPDELSMIKILNEAGYETYLLMSADKAFNNDETIFKKLGFQHVIGAETWQLDPHKQPFIEDWGLMDRVLYQTALDLLRQNQSKKIYIHVANADTHGPEMRHYYGSLSYPALPACIAALARDPLAQNFLAAIFRHDYDIGQTFKELWEQNLLSDDTLVVLTADHNFPHAEALNAIPGYPINEHVRIPLAFFSGQPLPRADLNRLHSQLDFAPTMIHLLNLPVPEGWWGESIFAPQAFAPRVSCSNRRITVETATNKQSISMDHPNGPLEKSLVDLCNCVYTNRPPATDIAR